jgi:hypothetical protein
MKKKQSYAPPSKTSGASRVAEPVQVYLSGADLDRLARLTITLDATKSEILRRGLEALDVLQQRAQSPQVKPVVLPTFCGDGLMPGVSLDSAAQLLDLMESESDAAT